MINPMSVIKSTFKEDFFKLKFKMLHIGMDLLFVIWSTTIGKIGSGYSLDSCFFFLCIFPFVASPFILSFFLLKSLYLQCKGTPLDRYPFFSTFILFFDSFHFCFLCFALFASQVVHMHNRKSLTSWM